MASKSEPLCYCSACIRSRRVEIIERVKPGYWLFDRNDNKVFRGEAIKNPKSGNIIQQNVKDVLSFHGTYPFSIYRWVTE